MAESNSTLDACASVQPPVTPPELDASSGVLPPWIILDKRVYVARRHNSTTASTVTSKGHAIQLTICLAHPPAASYVCVDCPGLSLSDGNALDILRSEKQFLLLRWSPDCEERLERPVEYYVYHAVPGKPSLCRIPDPAPGSRLRADSLGIYCCGGAAGEEDYILPGLNYTPGGHYELHLYSSASQAWTVKNADFTIQPKGRYMPVYLKKVIPLGGSLFGWVDLEKGILVCDVLCPDRDVPLWSIPLPVLIPENDRDHRYGHLRDVRCTNGSLKFVEIEHFRLPDAPQENDDPDVFYDDRCVVSPPGEYHPDSWWWPHSLFGWKAVVWSRAVFDNCWVLAQGVRGPCRGHSCGEPTPFCSAGAARGRCGWKLDDVQLVAIFTHPQCPW